jgi:hypothetical protein
MRKIERIQVCPEDRERLVRLVRDRNAQKIVWRSQTVIWPAMALAWSSWARMGKSVLTVCRCWRRYAANGVDGLLRTRHTPAQKQAADGEEKS